MDRFHPAGRRTVGLRRPGNSGPGGPTIHQRVTSDGSLDLSVYLTPDQPLPVYESVRPVSRSLVAMAGVAALGAGVSHGLALQSHKQWEDPAASSSLAELDGYRAQTNRREAVAVGLGVVALGSGGGALLVGRW